MPFKPGHKTPNAARWREEYLKALKDAVTPDRMAKLICKNYQMAMRDDCDPKLCLAILSELARRLIGEPAPHDDQGMSQEEVDRQFQLLVESRARELNQQTLVSNVVPVGPVGSPNPTDLQ